MSQVAAMPTFPTLPLTQIRASAFNPRKRLDPAKLKDLGYSAEDLATKTGKSRAYVYTRLKLVHLPDIAKKALWEERINASIAHLIARIPDTKLQVQATKDILSGEGTGEPMNMRAAV